MKIIKYTFLFILPLLFIFCHSNVVAAQVSAPALTSAAVSTTQINLSWADPLTHFSGRQIEVRLSVAGVVFCRLI